MKTLTLTAPERARLDSVGSVLVVRLVRWPSKGFTWTPLWDEAWVDKGWGEADCGAYLHVPCTRDDDRISWRVFCPIGRPGDVLGVRESFYCDDFEYPNGPIDDMKRALHYRAEHNCSDWEAGCPCNDNAWRPASTMPAWAIRTRVRVETVTAKRLRDVSGAEAIDAGIEPDDYYPEWSATVDEDNWVCEYCGGEGVREYMDASDEWGEDCPSEVNHLIVCRHCASADRTRLHAIACYGLQQEFARRHRNATPDSWVWAGLVRMDKQEEESR